MRSSLAPRENISPRKGYPDFSIENQVEGMSCGVDEVGRGPLAGAVVAACVLIPPDLRTLPFVSEIRDSKKLSFAKLEKLYDAITEHFPYAIAEISPQEIDEINILQASLKAMRECVLSLCHPSATSQNDSFMALIDGNKIPKDLPCPATAVVKGDAKSVSIAAASIVAKVHRDRLMTRLAVEYPHYGWERNVGYPTAEHLAAIERHGITPHHRRSFAPVRRYLQR